MSEQRGPCRVGTGAPVVHRRSARPGPRRALLLRVPGVGWSEEKGPRHPAVLLPAPCGAASGWLRPSRGPQAASGRACCLLAAGSAGKGSAHKGNIAVPRFRFSHKHLLFCSDVVRRNKSLRRVISLLSLSYLQVQNRGVTATARPPGGGLAGAVPCPVLQPPQCPGTNATPGLPCTHRYPNGNQRQKCCGHDFQQQTALC